MTVSDLIYYHKRNYPTGHFFSTDTLKFFGERISEMRVLKETVKVKTWSGEVHECYVLSSLQRKNPSGPKRAYHYFDINTFELIPQ